VNGETRTQCMLDVSCIRQGLGTRGRQECSMEALSVRPYGLLPRVNASDHSTKHFPEHSVIVLVASGESAASNRVIAWVPST
jgi:hypothetical protein